MGCGCNKGKTTTTTAASALTSQLYEVVDGGGAIRLRTRDAKIAADRADANTGWRWRKAGER